MLGICVHQSQRLMHVSTASEPNEKTFNAHHDCLMQKPKVKSCVLIHPLKWNPLAVLHYVVKDKQVIFASDKKEAFDLVSMDWFIAPGHLQA